MPTRKRQPWILWMGGVGLVLILSLVCYFLVRRPPTVLPPQVSPPPTTSPLYAKAMLLGEGAQWRPYPLLVDLNGDGHLDLVATHRFPADDNSLHIWLGTGQGTFNAVPQTWSSPGYAALAAGDINHDGHLDLLAASHFHQLITFLGDGTGGMTATVLETQDGYVAARLADVNGDGHLDAIVLGYSEAGLEVYLGDGTGQWTLVAQLIQGNIGRDLAVVDMNGDGKLDIVAVFEHGVVVFLQDGTGSWSQSPPDAYAIPGEFWSVAVGDVNQDGHLDLALNGQFLEPSLPHGPDVYLGDGTGGWTPASNGLKVFQLHSRGIALGDVDHDGCLDLVVGANITARPSDTAYGLFLFTGDCRGNWTLQPDSGLPSAGLMPSQGIALGDLNHDGFLDIVVAHAAEGGYLSVWLHR